MSNPAPAPFWSRFSGRIGFLLLAFWVALQSLIQLGVPLGQIAAAVGWLGLITAVCLLFGI